MMRFQGRPALRSCLAVLTCASLAAGAGPGALAAGMSSLTGRVVAQGGDGPIVGARLHAGHRDSGQAFRSEVTTADGTFRLESLPPGSYDLAVEAHGGLYLIEMPVMLAAGTARTVNVRLDPKKDTDPAHKRKPTKFKKPTALDNPATALLIVLGFGFLYGGVDELLEDDKPQEPTASPSVVR